jgi:predicted membrane chloride channel (bestrophin family)
MKQFGLNFLRIINVQTGAVTAVSLLATWICLQNNWVINLPTGLIGIAIVFPIVFSINAAYRRREDALKAFASLKANMVALYYVHRDWTPGGDNEAHVARMEGLFVALFTAVRGALDGKLEERKGLTAVFAVFSDLSHSIEKLRAAGMAGGEVSRANQYLRNGMADFERMHNISQYRTPVSLRAYSQVFLNIFPLLFAPYFAYLSTENAAVTGFLIAVLYSVVLVSLDNIQEDLENPYDSIGLDDLNLDVGKLYLEAVGDGEV